MWPKYKNKFVFILILLILHSQPIALITYRPKPLINDPWYADSLFVGACLLVKDSAQDIVVSWRNAWTSPALGLLSFMFPGHIDSTRTLFHNLHNLFPQEDTIVNLGKYPTGTRLDFMYMVLDTSLVYKPMSYKKLYSGQNRDSMDAYVSEKSSSAYQKRWAVAGRIVNTDSAEMGFGDMTAPNFLGIVFKVSNVIVEGQGKYKLSEPLISPDSNGFDVSIQVSLLMHSDGSLAIIERGTNLIDTINPKKNGAILNLFYTLDNSDPYNSQTKIRYLDTISFSATTTIKACAIIQGDSNWFPSDVVTKTFIKEADNVMKRKNKPIYSIVFNKLTYVNLYSLNGRLVLTGFTSVKNENAISCLNIPRGVYLIKSSLKNGKSSVNKIFVY
jgi:hypothetical protein